MTDPADVGVLLFASGGPSIPISIYKNLGDAVQAMYPILGSPRSLSLNGGQIIYGEYDSKGHRFVQSDPPIEKVMEDLKKGATCATWSGDIDEKQWNKLFKKYYAGCGEACNVVAQTLEFGKLRLFAWDLD